MLGPDVHWLFEQVLALTQNFQPSSPAFPEVFFCIAFSSLDPNNFGNKIPNWTMQRNPGWTTHSSSMGSEHVGRSYVLSLLGCLQFYTAYRTHIAYRTTDKAVAIITWQVFGFQTAGLFGKLFNFEGVLSTDPWRGQCITCITGRRFRSPDTVSGLYEALGTPSLNTLPNERKHINPTN